MSTTLIADLRRQLAAERDHGKRLQMQLDSILSTESNSEQNAAGHVSDTLSVANGRNTAEPAPAAPLLDGDLATQRAIHDSCREKPQRCDCGRFPLVHDKGDLCNIGFNEFLGRVQGKLIDMGYEPPLWPEPHIRDCGDVDEALDVCVQWCAARLDEAKSALSATSRSAIIEECIDALERGGEPQAVHILRGLDSCTAEKRKA